MTSSHYDAVIIGCGPGGSSAATYLSRAQKRVLVLEKEIFPRFHIGESLLPNNQLIFAEMGVAALQAACFPRKCGAQFHLGNGTLATRFVFRQGKFTRVPETIQVERALFDHILLRHARACGADVREGWTVKRFRNEGESMVVEATDPSGQPHEFHAPFLIDASGRGNLTGNQQGLRVVHPRHKKLAVFGHFTGVLLDEGEPGGDTVIVRLDNKWFWLIPISETKTSVGLVIDAERYAREKVDARTVFERWVEASPPLRKRMAKAQIVGQIHTTSDFSYFNRRLVEHRLLRVGDAAGFMDPIFSAGVFLAMHSGKLAANAVRESLERGDDGARRFAAYERRIWVSLKRYWSLVEHYYTQPFIDLFMQPSERYNLQSAVIAILAGDFEGSWALRWRWRLFFFFVWMQARRPMAPRVSLALPNAPVSESKDPTVRM